MNFLQMTSSEKDYFFSQKADNPEFEGQTKGQVLYADIVKSFQEKYTPDNTKNLKEKAAEYKKQLNLQIADTVGADYVETYLNNLQYLRKKRQNDIMQTVEHLYHFSQVMPDKLSQLKPYKQETGNALQENIDAALCYADTKLETVYPLKPSTNNAQAYEGISVYMDEQCLLVSGKDFAQYVRSLSPSYRYEVDKSPFKPVVDLGGHFCNEYESKEPVDVIKHEGPFDIRDVCKKWNISLFYIPNNDDKDMLCKEYSALMRDGMSRKDAMTAVCHQYPDKMKLFQEDAKLQKIANIYAAANYIRKLRGFSDSGQTSQEDNNTILKQSQKKKQCLFSPIQPTRGSGKTY